MGRRSIVFATGAPTCSRSLGLWVRLRLSAYRVRLRLRLYRPPKSKHSRFGVERTKATALAQSLYKSEPPERPTSLFLNGGGWSRTTTQRICRPHDLRATAPVLALSQLPRQFPTRLSCRSWQLESVSLSRCMLSAFAGSTKKPQYRLFADTHNDVAAPLTRQVSTICGYCALARICTPHGHIAI